MRNKNITIICPRNYRKDLQSDSFVCDSRTSAAAHSYGLTAPPPPQSTMWSKVLGKKEKMAEGNKVTTVQSAHEWFKKVTTAPDSYVKYGDLLEVA